MNEQESLQDYLNRLASSDPTPGGGAAAAVSGAQAVALLLMVCRLTSGKKFASVSEQINELETLLIQNKSAFLALKDEDEKAFQELMSCYKLPKSNEDEAAIRLAKIRESLYLAARAPMQMIEEVLRVLPSTSTLIRIGNKNLITDIGVAVHLLDTTVQSARLNVLINTRLVDNPDFDKECRRVISIAEKLISAHKKEVMEVVENFL